jgi:hypothetical protein
LFSPLSDASGVAFSLFFKFKTELETIAHLVDRSKSYPPWRRTMSIHYDYERNYAKAQITEGYEEGKTYIRRYDKVRSPLMDSLILY